MRSQALLFSLLLGSQPLSAEDGGIPLPEPAAEAAPAPTTHTTSTAAVAAGAGKPDAIANGERITIRGGDLTIKPPRGWEIFSRLDSLTLLMQVPHQAGMRYQRTIQIASFSEPRFIDELTAREYENVIVQKFSSISSTIEDYRIRNHMTVDLEDGRTALLFYTEFKLEEVPLMQAHILISSATRHYLMTYTDVAEHFESDEASQFLTEAWDSMISTELATRTPQRFEVFAAVGVGVVVLTVFGFMFVAYRTWRSGRNYHQYADGREIDDEPLTSLVPRSMKSRTPVSDPQSLASSDHPPSGESSPEEEDEVTREDIAV